MVLIASASFAVFDLDGPPSPSATITGLFHSGEGHQILSLKRELRLGLVLSDSDTLPRCGGGRD